MNKKKVFGLSLVALGIASAIPLSNFIIGNHIEETVLDFQSFINKDETLKRGVEIESYQKNLFDSEVLYKVTLSNNNIQKLKITLDHGLFIFDSTTHKLGLAHGFVELLDKDNKVVSKENEKLELVIPFNGDVLFYQPKLAMAGGYFTKDNSFKVGINSLGDDFLQAKNISITYKKENDLTLYMGEVFSKSNNEYDLKFKDVEFNFGLMKDNFKSSLKTKVMVKQDENWKNLMDLKANHELLVKGIGNKDYLFNFAKEAMFKGKENILDKPPEMYVSDYFKNINNIRVRGDLSFTSEIDKKEQTTSVNYDLDHYFDNAQKINTGIFMLDSFNNYLGTTSFNKVNLKLNKNQIMYVVNNLPIHQEEAMLIESLYDELTEQRITYKAKNQKEKLLDKDVIEVENLKQFIMKNNNFKAISKGLKKDKQKWLAENILNDVLSITDTTPDEMAMLLQRYEVKVREQYLKVTLNKKNKEKFFALLNNIFDEIEQKDRAKKAKDKKAGNKPKPVEKQTIQLFQKINADGSKEQVPEIAELDLIFNIGKGVEHITINGEKVKKDFVLEKGVNILH